MIGRPHCRKAAIAAAVQQDVAADERASCSAVDVVPSARGFSLAGAQCFPRLGVLELRPDLQLMLVQSTGEYER